MLDLFLCHAPTDEGVARRIAARIEQTGALRVVLDAVRGESGVSVASEWEGGLSSAAILLLLSPDSVPARSSREAWDGVLQHIGRGDHPPVAALLLRDCPYPRLLDRRHLFRWTDRSETLRELERWVLGHAPRFYQRTFIPARLPWFRGRETELETLWTSLADRPGILALTGNGASSLAQEFARQSLGHFREVIWIGCGDSSPAYIAGELGSRLGSPAAAPLESSTPALARITAEQRLLLVFDEVTEPLPPLWSDDGRTSVLLTARDRGVVPDHATVLTLEPPPAVPAAPHGSPPALALLEALSACRPQDAPLELARLITGRTAAEMLAGVDELTEAQLIAPLDQDRARFRVTPAPRSPGPSIEARQRHARAVLLAEESPSFAEVPAAFRFASHSDWPLAVQIARRAFSSLRLRQRTAEGVELLNALHAAATRLTDGETLAFCEWELSWFDARFPAPPPSGRSQQLALNFS